MPKSDVRCPQCNHLLFKVGLPWPADFQSSIEIKCQKCKALIRWPATQQGEVIESGQSGPSEILKHGYPPPPPPREPELSLPG